MQVITLVAVVVVAILFAASANGEHNWFDQQQLEECKKEFNVTSKPDWGSITDDMPENIKCFVKCLVSQIGLVSDDGDIDELVLLDMYAEGNSDRTMDVKEAINDCRGLLIDTTCDSMTEFFLCIKMDMTEREH